MGSKRGTGALGRDSTGPEIAPEEYRKARENFDHKKLRSRNRHIQVKNNSKQRLKIACLARTCSC